ncbi:glutaminase A [Gordonia sp. X0973]|uniref:glutaminase A n=1 Tax=Gordonia sp. X0973 TaxID=2742602 RepID=UPI000F526CD7|nr:glutaminase A [Gordonia sp. X0973]QKT07990.1 glutaminase A [Gordonia sp. X0973]
MFKTDTDHIDQRVSTGALPDLDETLGLLREVHERYRGLDDGAVADYIPALAKVDPSLFGISACSVDGHVADVGDARHEFAIESASKAFVFALVTDALGHDAIKKRIGVNNTGLPFNSVMAIELNHGSAMNPLVNAGAISATALMPGKTPDEQWHHLLAGLSAFAGRELTLDTEVYESEMATNQRNLALARLLQSYGNFENDPTEMVDVYTRQCSLRVTAHDLAVMGATLADGGVNPVTGAHVVSPRVCRDTLAVIATSGMYERSGEWMFEIGIPAKSGVGGGIVAVAPGKGAVGTFSPPLDVAGNSVRGQYAIGHLSRSLGLNVFASAAREGMA